MLTPNTLLQDRFLIVRLLKRGGMGAVYEAFDRRLNRTVALKETLADTEELSKAFEREANLLAILNHPALPKVTDHFVDRDGQYLVMDFIPGHDLGIQLKERREPFGCPEVLRWADELLDVLEYLHTHEPRIIHRDIKPANLKLSAEGKVILLDFGLAKSSSHVTHTIKSISVSGYTPSYASLEQIQGEGTNALSDLYSLAATLYSLLTGDLPPDALKRATAIFNDQPDPLLSIKERVPQLSEQVAEVLMQALSLKPARRPQSAAVMRAAMSDGAAGFQPADLLDDEATLVRSGGSPASRTGARRIEIEIPSPGNSSLAPPPSPNLERRFSGDEGVSTLDQPPPVPQPAPQPPASKRATNKRAVAAIGVILLLLFSGVIYAFYMANKAAPPMLMNSSAASLTNTSVPSSRPNPANVSNVTANREATVPAIPPPPSHINAQHWEAMYTWLSAKTNFRLAEEADCTNKQGLAEQRANNGRDFQPYYIAKDFNRDGKTDFAIGLINKTKSRQKFAVAIFNGPFNVGENRNPAFYQEGIELRDGGLAFGFGEPRRNLLIATPYAPTDAFIYFEPRGNSYSAKSLAEGF
jgi:serine/threonine protein kinase